MQRKLQLNTLKFVRRHFQTLSSHQPSIDGLQYIPNYISQKEQENLIDLVNAGKWFTAIRRRIQFYGPVYYYTRHHLPEVQPENYYEVDPLAKVQFLMDRFIQDGLFHERNMPNQCLVNEYVSNQNIADHMDNDQVFGDTIVGLSLLEPSVMTFSPISAAANDKNEGELQQREKSKFSVLLEPCSLYVFRGEARYQWKHGIKSSKKLLLPGSTDDYIIRDENYRRISLTFRYVDLNWLESCTSKSSSNKPNFDKE